MKLIIHRGTHEIGGSCVELCSDSGDTRIVLDIGMPLVEPDESPFEWKKYQRKPIEDLISRKIMPPVEGLYYICQQPSVSAVILSHAHQDHYGYLRFVHPDVPVYMSEGTKSIVDVSRIFLKDIGISAEQLGRVITFDMQKQFRVGEFTIKPYLMDHSMADAAAFLIEADGKRLFYTGDFRGHGRKSILLDRLKKYPPRDIDCLVMEGSMLGRTEGFYHDEYAVEKAMYEIISAQRSYTFIFSSSQNLDRIVSIFKATVNQAHKTLVIDLYTAFVLKKLGDSLHSTSIPQFDWNGIRILSAKHHEKTLEGYDAQLLAKFKEKEITLDELKSRPQDIVFISKDNSLFPDTLKKLEATSDAIAIYSQWNGYLERSDLEEYLREYSISKKEIHTSGHAYVEDLQGLASVLQPAHTIPIHTFHPDKFKDLFPNVVQLKDGECLEV